MYAQACGFMTCQTSIIPRRQQGDVLAILVVLFAWAVEIHKLESNHATEELANNNVLATFKEHELEPTELAKKELQSFTKSDAEELPSKKATNN